MQMHLVLHSTTGYKWTNLFMFYEIIVAITDVIRAFYLNQFRWYLKFTEDSADECGFCLDSMRKGRYLSTYVQEPDHFRTSATRWIKSRMQDRVSSVHCGDKHQGHKYKRIFALKHNFVLQEG
jgi:hypothetical protein